MPKVFVIVLAKAIGRLSRLINRGSGSALPGLVAEKLRPKLMAELLRQIPEGVIIVTGTNGKTTTTKMVVDLLRFSGKKVLTNESGSNFTRGILSTLIRKADSQGLIEADIAVLELDEAYAPLIAKKVHTRLVLALNVHRDQLDRYGEIDKTASMIGRSMGYAKQVIVNADDPLLVAQAKKLTGVKVQYYGVAEDLRSKLPTDDELHGGRARKHERPKLNLTLEAYQPGKITIAFSRDKRNHAAFHLPGLYNAANATGAVLAVNSLTEMTTSLVKELSVISTPFGRGEEVTIDGKKLTLGLVKNPSGFNQNIETMLDQSVGTVMIAVNDNYADGRDVSWLWDVHFEKYRHLFDGKKVLVSGVRAYDMALRLHEAGIKTDVVNVNMKKVLEQSFPKDLQDRNVVIFPTYTAMLFLRSELGKHVEMEGIW